MAVSMKPLKPALREKKRYIVVEFQGNKTQTMKAIESALKEFLGILGMSKVNPHIMKETFEDGKGIIRINHRFKDETLVGLSLVKGLKVRGVSGILNKAKEKFMEK